MFPWPTAQLQEPSLHLLTLNPRDKQLVGWNLEGRSTILLPAITTNGRISTLSVANKDDFLKLQNDILLKIYNDWGNCKTHICAGVNFVHPRNQHSSVLIYQISGSYNALPEIENMYNILIGLSDRRKGDEVWNAIEIYFNTEPRKSWINGLISNLRQTLHWNETVDGELALLK